MSQEERITETEQRDRAAIIELLLTGNFVQDRLTDALKPYNLSLAQFNVLRILRGRKGKPASLACVNEKMIHKMSNTTRLIDKLLEKDLVERMTCPENRRKIEITITSEGLKLLEVLDSVIAQSEAGIMRRLRKEEVTSLTALLKKLKA